MGSCSSLLKGGGWLNGKAWIDDLLTSSILQYYESTLEVTGHRQGSVPETNISPSFKPPGEYNIRNNSDRLSLPYSSSRVARAAACLLYGGTYGHPPASVSTAPTTILAAYCTTARHQAAWIVLLSIYKPASDIATPNHSPTLVLSPAA